MRAAAVAVALAVAVTLPGCGSDSDPEPPPDAGDGGTPGGGDTGGTPAGGDAGGTPSGGDPGGTPSGGDTGGTPAGDGGTPGDGGGATPAWPVFSKDGTVRIDRIDANAECEGLVPSAAPDAVVATVVPGTFRACDGWGAVSDGSGHVALSVTSQRSGMERQAFTPGGAPLKRFWTGWRLLPQPQGWIAGSDGVYPTPDGFAETTAYAPDGTPGRTVRVERSIDSPIHQSVLAEDPLGGALLVHAWHDTDGSGRCGGDARRIDAAGAMRGAPGEIGCSISGAGVSSRGEALVLEDRRGELYVHWLRADGTPARAPALEGRTEERFTPGGRVRLAPLLDGSLAVSESDRWTWRYPHLALGAGPAPEWLAARSGWTFRNTRGNRGYAFFPPGAESPECAQAIELRAPSGRLCGKVTLSNPGGACRTGFADQGWDGTVVEKDVREECRWRWWPRLLARSG